jgi:hypothetical protein
MNWLYRMIPIVVVFAPALSFSGQSSGPDPLFARMQGEWFGEGERTQTISGRKVRLEAEVTSAVEGDRLVSRNQLREVPESPDEPKRHYVRVYWIARASGAEYELGYGTGNDSRVSAQGRLDGNVFEVEQNIGGEPAFIVISRTEFLQDGITDYVETGWNGQTQVSETRIRYRRRGSVDSASP